jgi:tetratricopeptide (TPR) repeat protein
MRMDAGRKGPLPQVVSAAMLAALVLILAAASAPRADEPAETNWIGKRVVQKHRDFTLRMQDGRTQRNVPLDRWRVEKAEGSRLWLSAEGSGIAGWAGAEEVVPVEAADAFFTGHVRDQPRDAFPYVMRAELRRESYLGNRTQISYPATHDAQDFKELDKALADLDQAVRIEPRYAAAYAVRASVWFVKGEFDKAIEAYDQAIKLDPGNAYNYANRGISWQYKGILTKAFADYKKAIQLETNLGLAYQWRGTAWLAAQKYDQAIVDLNEAIRLDPRQAAAFEHRGLAWWCNGHADKAIADFDEAIRLDPRDFMPFRHRAWIWACSPDAKSRDGKRAVESATKACELSNWKDVDALDALAAAYAEIGDFDAAVRCHTAADALVPNVIARLIRKLILEMYRAKEPIRITTVRASIY